MKKVLQNFFIPHRTNQYRPYILRNATIATLLAVVLLTQVFYLLPTLNLLGGQGYLANVLSSVLVDLTNGDRVAAQEAPLKINPVLTMAAGLKAQDMAKRGYFSHVTPEGLPPWAFFTQAGYHYAAAGENLAVNFTDSADVERAWMNSPGHRANILKGNFTEIGIAVAQGVYEGRPAIFVVQFFGRPAITTAVNTTTQHLPPQPAAVAASNASATTWVDRIMSAPHTTTNYIYLIIGIIVLIGLFLTVFIKIKIQHRDLILNALIVLLIISVLMVLNQYFSLSMGQVAIR